MLSSATKRRWARTHHKRNVLKVHISANTSTELHIIGIFQRNICAFWNCSASTAVSNFSDCNLSTCHSPFLQITDLKWTELKWQGRKTTRSLPVTDGTRVDRFTGTLPLRRTLQETGGLQPRRSWLTASLMETGINPAVLGRRQRGGFSIFLRPLWRTWLTRFRTD